MMRRTLRRWLGAAVAASAVAALPARGQTRQATVRLVVPFAPGGGNDAFARQMADGLDRTFGRAVVVENRPGAGGIPGASAVASAPADGHTLLFANTNIAINPSLYKKLPYDTAAAFAPVVLMVQVAQRGLHPENRRRLMCLSLFWHFLDVIWIGVFSFVYLLGVLQ